MLYYTCISIYLQRGGYVKDNDTDRYGNQSWVFENNGTATFSPGLHLQPGTGTNDCAVKGVKVENLVHCRNYKFLTLKRLNANADDKFEIGTIKVFL